MTIRKKSIAMEQQALLWLQQYEKFSGADLKHPAVQAIRDLANKGVLFDTRAEEDLYLQMQALAIRFGGKSYEEALEILAERKHLSESTVGRRIKRKSTIPPELQALSGSDSLKQFLFYAAQVKLRSKHHKD